MPIYVNDNGTWREVNESLTVNDNGTNREIDEGYVNDNGTWRLMYEGVAAYSGIISTANADNSNPTNPLLGFSRSLLNLMPFGVIRGDDAQLARITNGSFNIGSGRQYWNDGAGTWSYGGSFTQFNPRLYTGETSANGVVYQTDGMTASAGTVNYLTWTDALTNQSITWGHAYNAQIFTISSPVAYSYRELTQDVVDGGTAGNKTDMIVANVVAYNKTNGDAYDMADLQVNLRSGQAENDANIGGQLRQLSGSPAPTTGNVSGTAGDRFRSLMQPARSKYNPTATPPFIQPNDLVGNGYWSHNFSVGFVGQGNITGVTFEAYGMPRWKDINGVIRTAESINWRKANSSVSMGMMADSSGQNNSNRATSFARVTFKNLSTGNTYTFKAGDSNVSISTTEDILGTYNVSFTFPGQVRNYLGDQYTDIEFKVYV
jgi:hypothetical protein|tara:strand:- start:7898 stop:9190 length:1293 start_codon:yes stop_codon:yes gene_type:complete